MMSSQHGPDTLGDTHATMARDKGKPTREGEPSPTKLVVVRMAGCNSPA
jgi:hypothetical protein